jgi:hypothetical protein
MLHLFVPLVGHPPRPVKLEGVQGLDDPEELGRLARKVRWPDRGIGIRPPADAHPSQSRRLGGALPSAAPMAQPRIGWVAVQVVESKTPGLHRGIHPMDQGLESALGPGPFALRRNASAQRLEPSIVKGVLGPAHAAGSRS